MSRSSEVGRSARASASSCNSIAATNGLICSNRLSISTVLLQRVTFLLFGANGHLTMRKRPMFFRVRSLPQNASTLMISVLWISSHLLTAKFNLWLKQPTRGTPKSVAILRFTSQLSPQINSMEDVSAIKKTKIKIKIK